MQRMPEKLVTVGKLYDLAEVHHGDAVRKILYHGKIVCNEQDGKSEAVAQLVKKIYDLRLNGNVQRGNRFIRNYKIRLKDYRSCDADPLPWPPENS